LLAKIYALLVAGMAEVAMIKSTISKQSLYLRKKTISPIAICFTKSFRKNKPTI
jgi:hypothetical protein